MCVFVPSSRLSIPFVRVGGPRALRQSPALRSSRQPFRRDSHARRRLPLPTGPSAGTYAVTFTAAFSDTGSDSFQGTLWREPCAGTTTDTTLYLRIAPTYGYPFICSVGFNVLQGGVQYDIMLTQSAGGADFCEDLLVPSTFIVDQWSFNPPFDRNAALTLVFSGVSQKYQVYLDVYGTPPGPVTPEVQTLWFVPPASDTGHMGIVRIANPGGASASVSFYGVDDSGYHSAGTASFTLGPGAAKQFTSAEIEGGAVWNGLVGSLGPPLAGNWRLHVSSATDIEVTSLIRVPGGFLTSMHDADVNKVQLSTFHVVPTVNPGSNVNFPSTLRFVNPNGSAVTVWLFAYDDAGQRAPVTGARSLSIDAFKAVHLSSAELENGAPAKGFATGLGTGTGKWRVAVSASLPIKVMNFISSTGGYITELPTESTALK